MKENSGIMKRRRPVAGFFHDVEKLAVTVITCRKKVSLTWGSAWP